MEANQATVFARDVRVQANAMYTDAYYMTMESYGTNAIAVEVQGSDQLHVRAAARRLSIHMDPATADAIIDALCEMRGRAIPAAPPAPDPAQTALPIGPAAQADGDPEYPREEAA